MRRVPVLFAAAALVVAVLPSAAIAHPAERFSDDHLAVFCDPFGDETATAAFYSDVSAQFGSYAEVGVWLAPDTPDFSPPTWISGDFQVDLVDDSDLTAVLDLYEFSEEPEGEPPFVGEAIVNAHLDPIGPATPFSDRSHDGNQQFRIEGVTQAYVVGGEMTLPGDLVLPLENCQAFHETYTVFFTNPDAWVSRSSGISISCSWELDGMSVFLSGFTDNVYSYADLFIGGETGAYYGYSEDASLTREAFSASFDLFSEGEGGPGELAGSVAADATLTPTGERSRFSDRFGWEKYMSIEERLAVLGSAEITLDGVVTSLPMDDETCYASTFRQHYRAANPDEHAKGPGGGRPLANDLPEDATPVDVPTSLSVKSTGGTAPEPEAPCIITEGEDQFEVPISHTAWWTFDGSGADVTIDTAGSSFDTVVGVYVVADGGYTQVGCVDDVFVDGEFQSLQAAITVGTEAAKTYYVQVGGFGGETGTLQLALY